MQRSNQKTISRFSVDIELFGNRLTVWCENWWEREHGGFGSKVENFNWTSISKDGIDVTSRYDNDEYGPMIEKLCLKEIHNEH